ncbi:I23O2 dioxygenase, partial [Nothoprocta ornata]|nr:I23O2 dioxygenase [Nothoprocta ornata]
TELPPPYEPWMEMAGRLPELLASRQLRARLLQMPQLSTRELSGHRELHLAHLVLGFLTMGYVWQEGEEGAAQVLPRNLAVPFWEVSQRLGLPPILSHADFVLANWRRRTPGGNLEPIVSLPGGESLRGFILVTLLVEKAAVPGIKAITQAVNAVLQRDEDALLRALQQLAGAIGDMKQALRRMHDHVDPGVFYSVIRIFLSGWRDNAAMPRGLLYEGVSEEPLALSGGSAAQSSVLHAYDELLGVQHRPQSAAFLRRMRDYMPPAHRAFVEEIRRAPSLRQHVERTGSAPLRGAFDRCVGALADFRTCHIAVVSTYISAAAARGPPRLQGRGTGGSHIFSFLKSVRDATREAVLSA